MAEENVIDKEKKPLKGNVSIHCFVCGTKVSVEGKVPGKTTDCNSCKTTLTVPDEDVLKKLASFESFTEIPSESVVDKSSDDKDDEKSKSDKKKDESSDAKEDEKSKSDKEDEKSKSDKEDEKSKSDKEDEKSDKEDEKSKSDNKDAKEDEKSKSVSEKKEEPAATKVETAHKIFCEGCGAKIDVSDQPEGSRFSCPACGMVLKVPARPDAEKKDEDKKEESSPKESKKSKSTKKESKKSKKETAEKKDEDKKEDGKKSSTASADKLKINCHTCGAKIDVTDQEPFKKVNCPACNAQFQVPKRFNHFLLEERLGENPNFSVYRALDLTLSREVCLKVMSKDLCENKEMVDEFLSVAGKIALVNDPNIVPIYSSGDDDGQSFLVMQYMGASSLDPYLEKAKGLLPLNSVYRCIRDAAKGLQAAENHGIEHNNISLKNILVDRDGNIKVSDFGFNYSLFKLKKDEDLIAFYNPLYISPEMAKEKTNDKKGDIYSLGAVFYHLITGVPTFPGKNPKEVVQQRLDRKPVTPNKVRSEVPAEVSEYIEKMMSESATDRPESFEAVVKKVEDFISTTSAAPSKSTADESSSNKGAFPAAASSPDKSSGAVSDTPKTDEIKKSDGEEEESGPNMGVIGGIAVAVIVILVLVMTGKGKGPKGGTDAGGTGVVQAPVNGTDTNPDAGTDTNPDAGTDTNPDAGTDTTPTNLPAADAPIIKRGHAVNLSDRPQPSGISFRPYTEQILEYLDLHGGDSYEQEKARIALLRTTKPYLERLLTYVPYQGQISVKGRDPIQGEIVEVTVKNVTIRANDADVTMSWNKFETAQFLDILDYYISKNKKQLETASGDAVLKNINSNIADDCFRAALICDWYNEPDRLYGYMKECLKHNPSLRPQLETLLPSISK